MQSFGVSGTSSNTGTGSWLSAHAELAYTDSPVTGNDYFTRHNRVRIIDGDGGSDSGDWAVFNFGQANGGGDYDGNSGSQAFFGGENVDSGGRGGLGAAIAYGQIWGYSGSIGWRLLYVIPMEPGNGMASHARGSWFDAGGTASGGGTPGKRPEYDTLAVSLVGFAVGAAMPGAACQPASSCVECMEGSYSSVSAATHCDLCAANATSPVGSTSASACVCKPGFEGDGHVNCTACAAGKHSGRTQCPGGWISLEGKCFGW